MFQYFGFKYYFMFFLEDLGAKIVILHQNFGVVFFLSFPLFVLADFDAKSHCNFNLMYV
jgi:hypothetical protein